MFTHLWTNVPSCQVALLSAAQVQWWLCRHLEGVHKQENLPTEWMASLCLSLLAELSCSQLGVGGVRVQMGYSQGSYSISTIQHVGQENLHTHVQMFLTVVIFLIHCLVKVCPVSFFFWLQISRLWEYGWNMLGQHGQLLIYHYRYRYLKGLNVLQ